MGVHLKWQNNSLGDAIVVYRSATPISPDALPTPIATLEAEAQSYDDLDAVDGETYHYRLQLVRGTAGVFSEEIVFLVSPPPAFSPAELFTPDTLGAFLNISDIDTLWSDDAGTVAAGVGDRVALIMDQSGNGCHAYQTDPSRRPYLRRDAAGALYLEANAFNWMYLGNTASQTSLGTFALVIAQRALNSSTVAVGKPHAASHSDPFFRWAFWRTDSRIECRVNGTPYTSGAGWGTTDKVLVLDTAAGVLKVQGGSGAFPAQTITYPNAVQARLFANSSGGELFSGRLYSLVMVGRALAESEREQLEQWAAGTMA